jgi:hypothetical protein
MANTYTGKGKHYLEQEHIWNHLLSHIKKFRPETVLLVGDVLELKTAESMFKFTSVYDGGIDALARVERFAPLNSEAQAILLEELGREIGAHWVGESAITRELLSSHCGNDPSIHHQRWQNGNLDILSTVMMRLLRWYIYSKLVNAYLPPRYTPSPTLLAYALGLEFWCVHETV